MGRSNNQRRALAKKTGTEFKPRTYKSKRYKASVKSNVEAAKKFNAKKNVGPRSRRQIAKDRKNKN